MVAPLLIASSSGWAWMSRSERTERSCRVGPGAEPGGFPPGATKRLSGARGRHLAAVSAGRPTMSQDLHGLRVVAAVGVADAAVFQRRLLVDAQLPLAVAEHVGELLAAGAELAAG